MNSSTKCIQQRIIISIIDYFGEIEMDTSTTKETYCFFCGENDTMKLQGCEHCKEVFYCGEDHKKLHYHYFEPEEDIM